MRLWMVIFAYLTWASIRSDVFVSGRCCTEALRIPKVWVWDGGRTGDEDLKQAMILTSRLKSANSPNKIFKILEAEMDTQIFDEIHASSAYHSLAVFRKKGQLEVEERSATGTRQALGESFGYQNSGDDGGRSFRPANCCQPSVERGAVAPGFPQFRGLRCSTGGVDFPTDAGDESPGTLQQLVGMRQATGGVWVKYWGTCLD